MGGFLFFERIVNIEYNYQSINNLLITLLIVISRQRKFFGVYNDHDIFQIYNNIIVAQFQNSNNIWF
jgi:hypothetical protein